MNSYQHITDRSEFIQKFRQDQGLQPSLQRNKSTDKLNKSRVNSSNNLSMSKSSLEGRWEYLFQLEKLKRTKLDEQRKLKDQQLFQKDLNECTFSPKLNTNKSVSLLSPKSLSSLGYSNGNRVPSTSDSMMAQSPDSLLGRQQQWNYKKNMRIENIKQTQMQNDNKECIFKPKLVREKVFINFYLLLHVLELT